MQYYQRKTKQPRKLYQSPVALVVIVVVTIILVSSSVHFYDAYRETKLNRDEAKAKLEELIAHKETVAAELAELETPEGTERVLREKYRVAKEGEGVVVIVDANKSLEDMQEEKRGILGWFERLFGIE